MYRRSYRLANPINDTFRKSFEDLKKNMSSGYLWINEYFLSTDLKQEYIFGNLPYDVQILRTSTTHPINFNNMNILIDSIKNIGIWGLNMGETECTKDAWYQLKNELKNTLIGFMWINEQGNMLSIDKQYHKYLQNTFRKIIKKNREKKTDQNGNQPWFDSTNSIMKENIASKFWFNPKNSLYFK